MPALAVLVASVALAGAGPADHVEEPPPPSEGFRVSMAVSARASKIAGKPVTAMCALDLPAWRHTLTVMGFSGYDNPAGFTLYEPQAFYVRAGTCRVLENHLKGRKVYLPELAREILTTTHEATHLKLGEHDEAIVECAAIRSVHRVARDLYGIRRKANLDRLMRSAWAWHWRTAREYRRLC